MKIGDVVQLKSGGPAMTVDEANDLPGYVHCAWWDRGAHFHGEAGSYAGTSFPIETLKPYEEDNE